MKRQAEAEGLDARVPRRGIPVALSPAARCAWGPTAIRSRRASAAPRPPTATSSAARGLASRTHLMSPAMAAAAAVTGRLADVRALLAAGRLSMEPLRRIDAVCRAARAAEHRHRPDHAGALPAEAALGQLRRIPVPATCGKRAGAAARADFPLNRPLYAGARVLVAGRNFGCGSSREHAVWALVRRRLPGRDRAELRRHLPHQRAEERPAAGHLPEDVVESLLDELQRRTGHADERRPVGRSSSRCPAAAPHTFRHRFVLRVSVCSRESTNSTTP